MYFYREQNVRWLYRYFGGWNSDNRAEENQTLSLPTLRERRDWPLLVFTYKKEKGKATWTYP